MWPIKVTMLISHDNLNMLVCEFEFIFELFN